MLKTCPGPIGLVMLILAFALVGWGCGTTTEPEPSTPESAVAADVAPAEDVPAPPGGGDIILSSSGWSQGNPATSITTSGTGLTIPSSFTGSATTLTLNPGNTSLTGPLVIKFPSNAGIKLTLGSPATWQCTADVTGTSPTWSTCTSSSTSTLSTKFDVSGANNTTAYVTVGTTDHHFTGTASLTIQ